MAYLAFLWTRTRAVDEPFVEYDGFGIALPADFAIHGIDVSRYQKKNFLAGREADGSGSV